MINFRLTAAVALASAAAAGWLLLGPTGAFMGDGPVPEQRAPQSPGLAALAPAESAGVPEADDVPPSSANPLIRIAIGSLDEIVERPLFSPDRRAPAEEPPAVVEFTPPAEEQFSPDDFTLLGVVDAGADKTALVRSNRTNEVLRLRPGQDFDGWTLQEVGDKSVIIAREGQDYPLKLFGTKPPAAAAAAPEPEEITAD